MKPETLNVMYILNRSFKRHAEQVFNPANAMVISKNDGMFNNDYNNQRDTIINSNTLIHLSRPYYSQEELDEIHALMRLGTVPV